MNRFLKKTVLFLLCSVTAFSAFACKKPAQSDQGGESLKLFINNGHYFDGKTKDSVWLEIENRTQTQFEITGDSHSGSYYTKLSPLMNTLVDAPDVVFLVPTSESLGLGTFTDVWCSPKRGLVKDFESMLADYPEGTFPYIEKMLFRSQYKNVMQNGKHYLLPNTTSANTWGIYYRKDWLIVAGYYTVDQNGNKVARYPTNMEEFTDVLEKFSRINQLAKEQGVTLKQTADKTYGFSPASGPHYWMPVYHAFGVTPDWDIYGDSVDYMYTNEKFKNFLEWANQMYSKGYIYPTFNSLATNSERQLFYDGQIGVMFTNAESHVKYIFSKLQNLGLYDDVGFGPVLEGTGKIGEKGSKGLSDWGGMWGGFCISQTCKNVKGALTLLNYLMSPEGCMLRTYGIEGVHYTLTDGEVTLTDENIENRIAEGNRFTTFEKDGEPLPTGNYEMGSYFGGFNDWDKYQKEGTLETVKDAYFIDQVYTDLVQDALNEVVLKSSKLVNFTNFNESTTSAMKKYEDTAKSYVNSVIMGQKGYSIAEWETLVANLKNSNKNKAMFQSANQTCREFGFIS